MPFFSSDLGLSQEYADPKVERVFQPQAPVSPFSGTRGITSDPLSQLAKAISGGTSGYTGAQFGDQTGLSTGGTSISPGMPSFPMPGIPETPAPVTSPVTGTTTGYLAAGGGDSATTDTTTIDSYQALQDYLNAPEWQTNITTGLLSAMGIPFAGSLVELGMGINPLGDLMGEGTQTMPWYEGATTYTGAPISDAQASLAGGMFTGYGSQYEADIVSMYGWGSPEHFAAIEEQLGVTTPEVTTTVPTTVESVVTQEPAPVDISSQWETTPGSEQTEMLAEQEAGLEDVSWSGTETTTDSGSDYSDSSSFGDMGGTDAGDAAAAAAGEEDSSGGWGGGYDSNADGGLGGGDSGGGDSGGGGGGSYIATAATQALGEKGLKVFEDWRDYMFTVLPTFTASFGRYRATAPKIVSEIDKKENSKNIYSWIWDMHLKPIYDLIVEDKDSDKALKDYKVMVRELSNKFLVKEKV